MYQVFGNSLYKRLRLVDSACMHVWVIRIGRTIRASWNHCEDLSRRMPPVTIVGLYRSVLTF